MKVNKNFFFVFFLFGILNFLKAQNYSYGIRASMFYNFDGKLKEIKQNAINIIDDKANAKAGWQAGGFARIKIPFLYIQPELIYTEFSHTYFNTKLSSFNSKVSRLDFSLPIGTFFLNFF
jgi:hypothetical protein